MTIGNRNITGSVEIRDFEITFGAIELVSNKSQMKFTYTGYAYPEYTNASLTVYDYSTDNGTTWSQMTASSDTDLAGLSFTEDGTTLTFKWEVKTDLGTSFYNKTLRIRMRALSGSTYSDLSTTSVLFSRSVSNVSTQNQAVPFPSDYSGVDGSELMKNAPKS
ncbi:MAG: hypothetical protein GF334_06130 [Candidatus Altiarchaeales archaeon]|nr:hypothetical protein [Candidatus Altiarchaeales archaeon]